MQLRANTVVMIVSLVAAGISAFFAWRISTVEGINELRTDLNQLKHKVPEAYVPKIKEISESTLPSDLMLRDATSELIRDQIDQIKAQLNGAVVAFDLNGRCPNGWDRFLEADGRVIVGAGVHKEQEYGRDLTAYRFGSDGGTRRHKLSINEMPQHDHDLTWGQRKGRSGSITGGDLKGNNLKVRDLVQKTGFRGDNAPHENMPPYKVLIYCKRSPQS